MNTDKGPAPAGTRLGTAADAAKPTWGFSVGGLEVLSLEAGKPFEARLRLTFEDYETPRPSSTHAWRRTSPTRRT